MDEKLKELLKYINDRLNIAGLELSELGVAEVKKRWKLPEDKGGYSNYWK
jgi:hypothetical protein